MAETNRPQPFWVEPEPCHPEKGRSVGAAAVDLPGIGHNRGPPLTPAQIWIELQRIVDMKEAERLSGLSHDTLQRRYPDRIVRLSERRVGMRLRHALLLGDDE